MTIYQAVHEVDRLEKVLHEIEAILSMPHDAVIFRAFLDTPNWVNLPLHLIPGVMALLEEEAMCLREQIQEAKTQIESRLNHEWGGQSQGLQKSPMHGSRI